MGFVTGTCMCAVMLLSLSDGLLLAGSMRALHPQAAILSYAMTAARAAYQYTFKPACIWRGVLT